MKAMSRQSAMGCADRGAVLLGFALRLAGVLAETAGRGQLFDRGSIALSN